MRGGEEGGRAPSRQVSWKGPIDAGRTKGTPGRTFWTGRSAGATALRLRTRAQAEESERASERARGRERWLRKAPSRDPPAVAHHATPPSPIGQRRACSQDTPAGKREGAGAECPPALRLREPPSLPHLASAAAAAAAPFPRALPPRKQASRDAAAAPRARGLGGQAEREAEIGRSSRAPPPSDAHPAIRRSASCTGGRGGLPAAA